MLFELGRVLVVLTLVGVAAALATPPGRLPLALRGVLKILRRDGQLPPSPADERKQAATWRRTLAFVLVLIAIFAAVM